MAEAAGRQLNQRVESGTLRDLLTEISWAKVSNVPPADYAELAIAGGRGRWPPSTPPASVASTTAMSGSRSTAG